MRIEIHCPQSIKASEECRVRALLINDGYQPVEVSRNAFVGPNVQELASTGSPRPDSVEPTFGGAEQPLTLQPFTFYGRERTFSNVAVGELKISATYRGSGVETVSASQSMRVDPP